MTDTPSTSPTATKPGKWRLYLILGGMAVFLAVVLWAVRDNQSAGDLAVGTCFDVPAQDTGIQTVTRHDCIEEHDAEVFHVTEFTGDSYPISLSLDRFIDSECVPAFTAYLGEDVASSGDFTIGYFYPGRDSWDAGDRLVTCYVVRSDETKVSQPLKALAGS